MHKKYEINQTKIKGGCQSGRKVVTHDSKSNLPQIQSMQQKNLTNFFSHTVLRFLKQIHNVNLVLSLSYQNHNLSMMMWPATFFLNELLELEANHS